MSSPDLRPLLTREGLVTTHALEGHKLRGRFLDAPQAVDERIVEEDQLADLLAREVGSMVIDLDQGTLEPEAVALLPSSIARKSLAIPVALAVEGSERVLQVAFANPLDTGNLAQIAASTGCTVRALVATVTSIRRALDREYGAEPPPTKVLDTRRSNPPPAQGSSDARLEDGLAAAASRPERADRGGAADGEPSAEHPLPTESTRQLAEQGPVTHPIHRIESEASVEQRLEALLQLLIERGVLTRTEYVETLRRLLSPR